MAEALQKYRQDVSLDYVASFLRVMGVVEQRKGDRPVYTQEDLKEFVTLVESILPTIRQTGDPTTFALLAAALKNSSIVKNKINVKRLEAVLGNRVIKTAAAVSYYGKAIEKPDESVLNDTYNPMENP